MFIKLKMKIAIKQVLEMMKWIMRMTTEKKRSKKRLSCNKIMASGWIKTVCCRSNGKTIINSINKSRRRIEMLINKLIMRSYDLVISN